MKLALALGCVMCLFLALSVAIELLDTIFGEDYSLDEEVNKACKVCEHKHECSHRVYINSYDDCVYWRQVREGRK